METYLFEKTNFVNRPVAQELKNKNIKLDCIALYRGVDLEPMGQIFADFQTHSNDDYQSEGSYWLACPMFQQVEDYLLLEKKPISYQGLENVTSYEELYQLKNDQLLNHLKSL